MQTKEQIEQVLREALAWGMVYGPHLNHSQWEEMREKMVQQFAARLEVKPLTSLELAAVAALAIESVQGILSKETSNANN